MMKKTNSILGGEDAGHIIIKPYQNTGDGVLIGILICNILNITKLKLSDLLKDYSEYFQAHANVQINKEFKLNKDINLLIKKYEHDGAKIIIRPSETEPVIRIMVEHENKSIATDILEKLKTYIIHHCL